MALKYESSVTFTSAKTIRSDHVIVSTIANLAERP